MPWSPLPSTTRAGQLGNDCGSIELPGRGYTRGPERLRLIELATADLVAAALHIEIEGTVARRQPPASTTTSALRRLRAVLGFAQLPAARA